MVEILYKEELLWQKMSRVAWLKDGDRNTSYFYRKGNWRKKKNNFQMLRK
jgi:hypothetical protein